MSEKIFKMYCLVQALKVGLACLVAILVIARFNIPSGFMVLLPITVIPIVFPHEIFGMAFERFLGALLGAVVAILFLSLVHNWWLASGFVFLVMMVSFMCFLTHRLHYAMVMFPITVGVVYLLNYTSSAAAELFSIQWPLNILLGVLIFFVVDGLIMSQHQYRKLLQLKEIFFKDPLKVKFEYLKHLLLASRVYVQKSTLQQYEHDLPLMEALQKDYISLKKLLESLRATPELSKIFSLQIDRLWSSLDEAFQLHTEEAVNKYRKELKSFMQFFSQVRAKEGLLQIDWVSLECLFEFQYKLEVFLINLEALSENKDALRDEKHAAPAFKLLHLQRAFSMAFAVMITILICAFLNLPGGVQPIIAAIVAVLQPNLGKSSKQIGDRLVGLGLGSMVAVLYALLLAKFNSLWMLMILYFVGITLASYIALYSKKFYYVALQAGVALTLVLTLNTTELAPSLGILAERIVGLFEGYLIAIVVVTLIYPKDPVALLPSSIQALLKKSVFFFKGLSVKKPQATQAILHEFQVVLTDISALVHDMQFEIGVSKKTVNYYQSLYAAVQSIEINLAKVADAFVFISKNEMGDLIDPICLQYSALAQCLDEISAALLVNDDRALSDLKDQLSNLVEKNHLMISEVRSQRKTKSLDELELSAFWMLLVGFDKLTHSFERLCEKV